MGFFQDTPKPVQTPKEKTKYADLKRCVMKKETGEISEECKKIFEKIGVED